jgi:hypothetical protein
MGQRADRSFKRAGRVAGFLTRGQAPHPPEVPFCDQSSVGSIAGEGMSKAGP